MYGFESVRTGQKEHMCFTSTGAQVQYAAYANEKMIEFACHKTANAPKPFKYLVAKNFIKLEVLFLFKAYFE